MMPCFLQKIYIPCGPLGITAVKHRSMPFNLQPCSVFYNDKTTLYIYVFTYITTPYNPQKCIIVYAMRLCSGFPFLDLSDTLRLGHKQIHLCLITCILLDDDWIRHLCPEFADIKVMRRCAERSINLRCLIQEAYARENLHHCLQLF